MTDPVKSNESDDVDADLHRRRVNWSRAFDVLVIVLFERAERYRMIRVGNALRNWDELDPFEQNAFRAGLLALIEDHRGDMIRLIQDRAELNGGVSQSVATPIAGSDE
jgi:hypothetical protein